MGGGKNMFAEFAQPTERLALQILLRVELIPVNFLQEHANLALIENRICPRKNMDQHGVTMAVGLEEAPNGWALRAPENFPVLRSYLDTYH